MLGAGFAGPTNYAGMADLVVMVEAFDHGHRRTGPGQGGHRRGCRSAGLGGADVQVDRHGLADLGVASEDEALDAVRRFLSYLPSNARGAGGAARPSAGRPDRRGRARPRADQPRKAYDVRKVLRLVADGDCYFELKPTFAANMVTALARIGGRPVGFIANQPQRLAGMINADACDKGAHFIALCDAFGLPLVSLIDVPGFSIGSEAERTSLGRRSAKLVFELGQATVPRVSIVLRKGYGLGYFAMCGGRSFAADACSPGPRRRSAPCRSRARSTWPSARTT